MCIDVSSYQSCLGALLKAGRYLLTRLWATT